MGGPALLGRETGETKCAVFLVDGPPFIYLGVLPLGALPLWSVFNSPGGASL